MSLLPVRDYHRLHGHDRHTARRASLQTGSQILYQEGLRIPPWLDIPEIGMPEVIDDYMKTLTPDDKKKVAEYLASKGSGTPER